MTSAFCIESLENRKLFSAVDVVDVSGGGSFRDGNWDLYDLTITQTSGSGDTTTGFDSGDIALSGTTGDGSFYSVFDVTLTLENTSYTAHLTGNADGDTTSGISSSFWELTFTRNGQFEDWIAEPAGNGINVAMEAANAAAANTTGAAPFVYFNADSNSGQFNLGVGWHPWAPRAEEVAEA